MPIMRKRQEALLNELLHGEGVKDIFGEQCLLKVIHKRLVEWALEGGLPHLYEIFPQLGGKLWRTHLCIYYVPIVMPLTGCRVPV